MNRKTTIHLSNAVPRFDHLQFRQPIEWKITEGQHWALIGPNGAGKTLLIDILTSKYALRDGRIICIDENGNHASVSSIVKSVAFEDIYNIIDNQNSYYQQRWNKGDKQDVPLVKEMIKNIDPKWLEKLVDWFEIKDLLEKEINLLSSGELRKFLIIKYLILKPRILIMDNPYIGLDSASRIILNDLFIRLSQIVNLQIVLLLSNPKDIPEMITHVLPIKDKCLYNEMKRAEFFRNEDFISNLFSKKQVQATTIKKDPSCSLNNNYENAVIMRNIQIKYGLQIVLKGLNWSIKRGEKWALLGPNGSGKSTLLSLICGDNPQAYANDIVLFDRKRGSGESIWDIKKHIGYISPEMHLYYLKNIPCIEVVGSGFFDTIGLYRKCSKEQIEIALQWMQLLDIQHLRNVSFLNISAGEQRLVLLARVLVKNPDLLILDEPLHGLDIENKKRVKLIIEKFCDKDKSLIYVTHYEDEIPNVVDKRLVLTKVVD